MSTAAAPMIGVASRNAKRAASSFDSPTQQAAAHRRARAREARDRARAPARRRRRAPAARRRCARDPLVVVAVSAARRATAQPLGAVEHHAVDRSGRTRPTLARRTASRSGCSSSRPRSPAGIVPTTSSQPSLRVGVVRGRSRGRAASARGRATIRTQSLPEEAEQDERRREMRRDEERDEELVVLVDVPAEQAAGGSRCARGWRSGTARETPWRSPSTTAWP